MLARKNRLPVNTFPSRAKILQRGQFFTIKATLNGLLHHRVGVVLTKKTAPKATERNRLRRKIFDLFRKVDKGIDLLVIIKPIKLDRDMERQLFKDLNSAKQKMDERS